jgi:DNA (cytosine-5)-methyltransferase 1
MNHGSFFSGIGGFDLAASWLGWDNVFFCEIDPFCRIILKNYWPYAKCIEDINHLPAIDTPVDVISGGFPCQAFSVAGRRQGTEDPRYLWPQMFAAVKLLRPPYVLAENVMGLLSWKDGLVFDQVHLDLEAAGYQVWAFVLPAVSVGAPHVRNRVWFAGYNPGFDQLRRPVNSPQAPPAGGLQPAATHPYGSRLEGTAGQSEAGASRRPAWSTTVPTWDHWTVEPAVCRKDDGVFSRLADISFSSWRTQSIKALGNSIVPQVAHRIFSVMETHRSYLRDQDGQKR